MATDRRSLDSDPRVFAAGSIALVLFGIGAVLLGSPAVATAGVLAVVVGAVALLLAVGRYMGA